MKTKWSKAEIKATEGHIQGGSLHAANGYQALGDTDYAAVVSELQRRKLDMALLSLRILIGVENEYIRQKSEFLAYLNTETGKRVYPGAHNDEMRVRFTECRVDHEKKLAKYRKLDAKLRAVGLPPELQR